MDMSCAEESARVLCAVVERRRSDGCAREGVVRRLAEAAVARCGDRDAAEWQRLLLKREVNP